MHQANYDTVKAHTTPCTGHEVPVIKVEFRILRTFSWQELDGGD
jgi:hypothetical protein